MAINREKARAAGYSDEEINAFEAEEAKKSPPPAPIATAEVDANEPPPPQTTIPEVNSSNSNLATVGLGVGDIASKVKDVAVPVGEGYLAYKGIQAYRANAAANQARAAADMASEAGRAARAAGRVPVPTGPAVPNNPILGPNGQPMPPRPVMPTGAAPVPPPPPASGPPTAGNFMSRMALMAKQYGPAAAKTGLGIGMATYSTPTGPAVPRVGRLRGSEINPLSGRPWTAQEIATYEANSQMFDSQLPPAQMQR